MDDTKPLINKAMPDDARGWAENQLCDGETVLFAVVGDLSLFEKYAASTLLITSRRAVIVDPNHENGFFSAAFSDIEKVSVKRMYGNARMNFTMKSGEEVTVFRYTYAVADLCDVAAAFIEAVGHGEDQGAQMEIVASAYEKKMRVCPKCGRTLLRPGAECIKCQSKGKIVSKLLKYVKPQFPLLLTALLMSMASTALALLPPSLTQRLVDDVLPNGKMQSLVAIVLMLFGSYVIGTLLNGFRNFILRISGDGIVRYLRNDVYEKAQHLPMKFYDKTSTGSVINRISGDTNTLQARRHHNHNVHQGLEAFASGAVPRAARRARREVFQPQDRAVLPQNLEEMGGGLVGAHRYDPVRPRRQIVRGRGARGEQVQKIQRRMV